MLWTSPNIPVNRKILNKYVELLQMKIKDNLQNQMYLLEMDRPDDDDDDYVPNPNDLLPGLFVRTVPVCEAEIAELKNKIIAAATSVELSGIVIIWTWKDCDCLKQIEEYIGHKYTGKILVPKTMSNDEDIEEAVETLNQSNMTFSYVHIQYGKFQDGLLWNEMDSPSIIQYDCLAEVPEGLFDSFKLLFKFFY